MPLELDNLIIDATEPSKPERGLEHQVASLGNSLQVGCKLNEALLQVEAKTILCIVEFVLWCKVSGFLTPSAGRIQKDSEPKLVPQLDE